MEATTTAIRNPFHRPLEREARAQWARDGHRVPAEVLPGGRTHQTAPRVPGRLPGRRRFHVCTAAGRVGAGEPTDQEAAVRAVVWHGKRDVRVEDVPDPVIQDPGDAVIRVTSTN